MKLLDYKKTIKKSLLKTTLCFLIKGNKILLGMKKRGFGKGKWNGVGGKADVNEEIEKAAIRELHEEIEVNASSLINKAVLYFYYSHDLKSNTRCYVFLCDNWTGEPRETDEMKPCWFDIDKLPFESMWPDDIHWLPKVLKNEFVKAEFLFGENQGLREFRFL